jgi:hypothetical protein
MMNSSIKVATPEEFVKRFGGARVINKVLIANNGIAGKSLIKVQVTTIFIRQIKNDLVKGVFKKLSFFLDKETWSIFLSFEI